MAWNKAISLVGAARAGTVYYLQPVCVAALSYLRELAGERPHRHVVAAVRRGAEDGAAVGQVLTVLRDVAAGLSQ